MVQRAQTQSPPPVLADMAAEPVVDHGKKRRTRPTKKLHNRKAPQPGPEPLRPVTPPLPKARVERRIAQSEPTTPIRGSSPLPDTDAPLRRRRRPPGIRPSELQGLKRSKTPSLSPMPLLPSPGATSFQGSPTEPQRGVKLYSWYYNALRPAGDVFKKYYRQNKSGGPPQERKAGPMTVRWNQRAPEVDADVQPEGGNRHYHQEPCGNI